MNLAISTTKLTANTLIRGFQAYLRHREKVKTKISEKLHTRIRGKQTVDQLVGQDQGVANIDIAKTEIRGFEKIARKYGIDYAITKDKSTDPPRYLVFFKAKDTDALNAAYKEYAAMAMKQRKKKLEKTAGKETEKRPSIRKELAKFKALIDALPVKTPVKDRQREQSR